MSAMSCSLLFLLFSLCLSSLHAGEGQQETPPQQNQHFAKESLLGSFASGQYDAIYRLLSQGHNPNVADNPSGWTPLIHASHLGDFHLVKAILIAGASINQGCADGWTPLMFACIRGHDNVVRLLLENGADVQLVSANGATALGSAKAGGNPIVIRLIEEALSVAKLHQVILEKEKGINGILLSSSHAGDYRVVEQLLREGNNPNIATVEGWTPLMLASARGNLDMLRVLIHYGANVNDQDEDGWSPLMFCTHSANIPCIVLLLESQANIFLTNKDNVTVLQMAMTEGHIEAFNAIVSMTYCHEFIENHTENLERMLADGVNPDAIDCTKVKAPQPQGREETAGSRKVTSEDNYSEGDETEF